MPSIGVNAAFAGGTGAIGASLNPFCAFNFLIEIDGILVGGFTECSGLSVETEYYDYREGGVNEYVHRLIGPTKYEPIILKHGLTFIDGLWRWHQEVIEGIEKGSFKRRNGTIFLLNQQKIPMKWWNFKEAYPYKWSGPELKADSSNIAFESVELTHRGLS